MAEGIKIEVYRLKNADELTKTLADPASRIETGSAAAVTAALAASLLERAAAMTADRKLLFIPTPSLSICRQRTVSGGSS